jgi:phosphoribosylanthranilate isomerase
VVPGIQIKVCGLTSLEDAACAAASGADFLGFILHEASPRRVTLDAYRGLSGGLKGKGSVAVMVEPAPGALSAARDAGFDRYQVHFRHDLAPGLVEGWASEVGPSNLWLAPKLPAGVDASPEWAGLCGAILLDTFDPVLFGGTGRTGDWAKFRRHLRSMPAFPWILSGGLNPSNVGAAIAETGARFVDVNSGVESSPGVKDRSKLVAFAGAVRAAGGG